LSATFREPGSYLDYRFHSDTLALNCLRP
jgi:hypothetical protein